MAVLGDLLDEVLMLQATTTAPTTTARGADSSAAVGGPCYLLFTFRFEPHVLQVRSFLPTTIMYELSLKLLICISS